MEILVKLILLLGFGVNIYLFGRNLSNWHLAKLPSVILNISFAMGCVVILFSDDPGWSFAFFFASYLILAPIGFLLEKRYTIAEE